MTLTEYKEKKLQDTAFKEEYEAIMKEISYESGLYKVQCGAFASKENAEAVVNRLKAVGIDAIIKEI